MLDDGDQSNDMARGLLVALGTYAMMDVEYFLSLCDIRCSCPSRWSILLIAPYTASLDRIVLLACPGLMEPRLQPEEPSRKRASCGTCTRLYLLFQLVSC